MTTLTEFQENQILNLFEEKQRFNLFGGTISALSDELKIQQSNQVKVGINKIIELLTEREVNN